MNKELTKGQRVRFVRKPEAPSFHSHYDMALEYIDRGKIYMVEHFFVGEPSQVELVGIDSILFMTEMFEIVE